MKRLICAAVLALAAGPLFASDFTTAWYRQLTLDGYEQIVVTKTWLGRHRIVAEKGNVKREIIINPRTGEVLRDYTRQADGSAGLPLGFDVDLEDDTSSNSSSGSSGSSSGSSDGGGDSGGDDGSEDSSDDEEDDENDDESDDSNEDESDDSSDDESDDESEDEKDENDD